MNTTTSCFYAADGSFDCTPSEGRTLMEYFSQQQSSSSSSSSSRPLPSHSPPSPGGRSGGREREPFFVAFALPFDSPKLYLNPDIVTSDSEMGTAKESRAAASQSMGYARDSSAYVAKADAAQEADWHVVQGQMAATAANGAIALASRAADGRVVVDREYGEDVRFAAGLQPLSA